MLVQSEAGLKERDPRKGSNLEHVQSIKILESNLSSIIGSKDIERDFKNQKMETAPSSNVQFQKRSSDICSSLSKSIGMQALGSENFGVPISTNHDDFQRPNNNINNKDKPKGKTSIQKKSSLLKKSKKHRKQSEDEEQRKRDAVLRELEVLNDEDCNLRQVQQTNSVDDDASDEI